MQIKTENCSQPQRLEQIELYSVSKKAIQNSSHIIYLILRD